MFSSISAQRRASTPCIAPNMRRSVTLPTFSGDGRRDSLPRAVSRDSSSPDPAIETLYCHPNARIIAFTANAPDGPGTMSWSSKTERTIAVGPLRIYKTPNNVIFLNCGLDFVRPVFPKSKCWCVEEASGKFILEMRKPQYWRIEVPCDDATDIASMDELKHVFANILLYEPFRRIFEPPEEPAVPIKYRPWTPRPSPLPTQAPDVDIFSQAVVDEIDSDPLLKSVASVDNFSVVSNDSQESDILSDYSAITEACPQQDAMPNFMPAIKPRTSIPRSITAPPQLTVFSSPPSKGRAKSPLGLSTSSSSSGSYQSITSWHEPIQPSRPSSPDLDASTFHKIHLPKRVRNADQQSLLCGDANALPLREETASDDEFQDFPTQVLEIVEHQYMSTKRPSTSSTTSQMTPLAPNFENAMLDSLPTPTSRTISPRVTTTNSIRQRREFSPMPNAINIFSPTKVRPRHLQTNKHLPTAILQKTCEILFSPPSHLVTLMLEWAARLTAGGWWGRENVGDGDVYCDGWGVGGWGSGTDWTSGKWEPSDGDLDDYGMVVVNNVQNSVSGRRSKRETRGDGDRGRSWEID